MRADPRYDELTVLERGRRVETYEFCEDLDREHGFDTAARLFRSSPGGDA